MVVWLALIIKHWSIIFRERLMLLLLLLLLKIWILNEMGQRGSCGNKWIRTGCVCSFQYEQSNTLLHVSSQIDESEWDDFRFFAVCVLFRLYYVKSDMINRNSCLIWQLFDLQKCTNSSILFCTFWYSPFIRKMYTDFFLYIISFSHSSGGKKTNK